MKFCLNIIVIFIMVQNLNKPKVPSFNITLANNIEQPPEADTCALLSQNCKKIIGTFLSNMNIKNIIIEISFTQKILNEIKKQFKSII